MSFATSRRPSWALLILWIYDAKSSRPVSAAQPCRHNWRAFLGSARRLSKSCYGCIAAPGPREPDRKRAGRPGLLDAAACDQVLRWPAEQNDLTLAEMA